VLPSLQEQHGLQSELTQLKQVRFKYLYNGFHSVEITDLAVCIQRPLFVTICGEDGTLRVWNFISMRCDLARKFEGKDGRTMGLQSVAFHPSGYYIALGFKDKLRIFHLMHRDLRLYKELSLTNTTKLKFSNGGHFLAASY
jgi:cilia- and flagella-associated protein 57